MGVLIYVSHCTTLYLELYVFFLLHNELLYSIVEPLHNHMSVLLSTLLAILPSFCLLLVYNVRLYTVLHLALWH